VNTSTMADYPNCPVCRAEARFYCRVSPAHYYRCDKCESIFQAPMPTIADMLRYADTEYADGKYTRYMKAEDIKRRTFRERVAGITRRTSGRRLLDVGCSCGFMLDEALDAGFDAWGVEFSRVAIAAASPQSRPRIIEGDVNSLGDQAIGAYDVVSAFDVVEHTLDPLQFLTGLRQLLRENGLLVITTPDTTHFLRRPMGSSWPMLQPYQHTVLFSRRSLRRALEHAGFKGVEIGTATKVLTPEYLVDQARAYAPLAGRAYDLVARLLPQRARTLSLRLNIGETLAFARR
jgi:SAM-dependent methyltransferase